VSPLARYSQLSRLLHYSLSLALRRSSQVLIFSGLLSFTGLLSIALGQDKNWDLLNYHLYAPYAYLHNRYLFDIGPAQFQSYLNPVADLLLYGLISFINDHPRLIAFIFGALHGINFFIVYKISRIAICDDDRTTQAFFRIAATAIGISGAGVVSALGTTTNDLLDSIFILGALLACLQFSVGTAHARANWLLLLLGGASLGAAVGLKFTAGLFLPAFGIIVLYLVAAAARYRLLLIFGLAALSCLFLTTGHHMLTMWRIFGNPMFPLFNGYFKSPFYDPVNLRDLRFLPGSVWAALFYPFYWATSLKPVVTEIPFRDIRLALAEALLAIMLLFTLAPRIVATRRAPKPMRPESRSFHLLVVFVTASYAVWVMMFGIYRYALVLEMLSGVVIVGTVIRLAASRIRSIVLSVACLVSVAVTTHYFNWGRTTFGSAYIEVHAPRLPSDSRLLVIGGAPVSYVVPFINPSVRVLAINNNYLGLAQHNRLVEALRRAVQNATTRFLLFPTEVDAEMIKTALDDLALKFVPSSCQPVEANIADRTIRICRLAGRSREEKAGSDKS
jgi:hypothetical protein